MNLDPRDIITADPYANLTSDEDEQIQIEKEIQEMERRKQDLLKRLEQKKVNSKKVDPNFVSVEVPKTPEKKKSTDDKFPNHDINTITFKLNLQDSKATFNNGEDNLNEIKLKEKYANKSVSNLSESTTSYFVNRFQESKKKEKLRIKAHESMMSSRIHTFGNNNNSKEYKHISVNELEEYSNLWISKRYIPEPQLKETLQNIKILRLNKLFAKVRPPKFEEPQYSNWVTLGIISQKSEVKYTTSAKPQKFIKLTLTNLKQQIDIFIFGDSGVQKYITLRVGDIIAILNPEILPWKPSSTSRGQHLIKSFNLKITHNYNCILEIGKSRDLGYCPIWNKSSNSKCGNCIDISVEKCCEYHREVQMRSSNAKRPDLNGGFSMGAPTKVGLQPSIYRGNVSKQNPSNSKWILSDNIQTEGISGKNSTLKNYGNGSNAPSFNLMSRTVGYNCQNEEELRKKSITARHFSSGNAAKAFFDDDYHNPDAVKKDLKNDKKRKTDEITQSKKFDKMLKKMFNKEIDLDERSSIEIDRLKNTTESVLQSGIIQNIGFDPTHGKIASVLQSKKFTSLSIKTEDFNSNDLSNFKNSDPHYNSKNDKKNVVKELLSFKKESVNLTPSAVHMMQRKEHRKAAWVEVFGTEKDRQKSRENDIELDSDLEII